MSSLYLFPNVYAPVEYEECKEDADKMIMVIGLTGKGKSLILNKLAHVLQNRTI